MAAEIPFWAGLTVISFFNFQGCMHHLCRHHGVELVGDAD
jgi:hypothetical protein